MATKGNSFRGLDYQQLEGGIGGGMSAGYKSSAMERRGPMALLAGAGAGAVADYASTKKRQQEDREAAAEMKRETRGVEKTSTDRAREAAEEASKQRKIDKAAEEASKDMGLKKGGSVSQASKRADGAAIKGKTRGTMVTMCGGGMYKGK